MQKLDRIIKKVVSGLNLVSSLVLLFMLVFILVYVILRAVFKYAIFGSFEIVQLSCMVLVACALAGNDYQDGNITVSVLVDKLPGKLKWAVELFALLVSSALCVYMTYLMWGNVLTRYATNAVTANLELPIWIFTLILFISFILLSLSVLCRTLKHVLGYKGSDQDEEDLAANL